MRIGPLVVRWLVRPAKTVVPPAADTDYGVAVSRIADALPSFDWYVAGGLVAPMMLGRYWRRHSDLDILVRLADVPAVRRALAALGYRLSLVILAKIGERQLVIRVPIPADATLARFPRARLSFEGPVNAVDGADFERIDVYRYVIEDGVARIFYRSGDVVVDRARLGVVVRLGRIPVPCLDLEHVDRFKADRTGPKHALDRSYIRSLRTAVGADSTDDDVRS